MATKSKTVNKKKATVKKSDPVKTAAVKKSKTSTKPQVFAKANVADSSRSSKPSPLRKLYVVLIILVVALIALAFKYRGVFVAATVNGQPISRLSVVKESEKQSGKQIINNLVRNNLIEQEAKKQNVTITDQEIDTEIKKVEDNLKKSGQKLEQVLSVQGLTKEDLRKLIRLDKLVGKMVGKDVKITDKQITDYIDKNKESLPQNQTEAQIKTTVAAQLKQQELNTKVQAWLANLQSKAKIQYFVQY